MPITDTTLRQRAETVCRTYGRAGDLISVDDVADDERFQRQPNRPLYLLDDDGGMTASGWYFDRYSDITDSEESGARYSWFARLLERFIDADPDAFVSPETVLTVAGTEVVAYFDLDGSLLCEQAYSAAHNEPALTRIWRTVEHPDFEPLAFILAWYYGGEPGRPGRLADPDRPIDRRSLDGVIAEAAAHTNHDRVSRREAEEHLREIFLGTDCTVLDALGLLPDDADLDIDRMSRFNPLLIG